MHRLDRALGILLCLRGGDRWSSGDLARRFDVSTRTIYRDLDLLGELGVPVYAERGRGGGVGLMSGYFLPPISFSREEAVSLVLAVALLRGLRGRPFASELETAERKLLAAVPSDTRSLMAEADRLVAFEETPETAFHHSPTDTRTTEMAMDDRRIGQVVTRFMRALLDRQSVHLRYQSPYKTAASETEARPLGLLWDRNLWYLLGTRRRDDEATIRQWRADRVIQIRTGVSLPTDEVQFDVRSRLGRVWLDEAMGDWANEAPVRIRMTSTQVALLRRDWYYGRARFEAAPNGMVEMTYGEENRAAVCALVRWLGPGATLVEPATWRASFGDDLLAMMSDHAPVSNHSACRANSTC